MASKFSGQGIEKNLNRRSAKSTAGESLIVMRALETRECRSGSATYAIPPYRGAPDAANDLTGKLQLFQKMMKYGLPTEGMIALYELGFSDRVVAAELSTSLGLVDEQHRDVFEKVKQERNSVAAILGNYPSYFTHVMNDVL